MPLKHTKPCRKLLDRKGVPNFQPQSKKDSTIEPWPSWAMESVGHDWLDQFVSLSPEKVTIPAKPCQFARNPLEGGDQYLGNFK